MKLPRKIATGIGIAFLGLFEIAERAEFVKTHLPGWITMHSDITVIALLIGLCLYLLISGEEKEQQVTATATAEGGKIEQHIHYPAPLAPITPSIPAPLPHNVQYLGVKIQDGIVTMCFENVNVANQPVGIFPNARLRVRYFLESTGEQIAVAFPARWATAEEDAINIGFIEQQAILAVHIGDKWEALSTLAFSFDEREEYHVERTKLPSGALRIVATLFGECNVSLTPISGILTLGENGSASFTERSTPTK